ncbi:E3 ubiquitin-protein ligase RFWD3-like [Anopheles stephensi]|uniref:E3 ubiquitin-protein ligase RFWD3-like n=1 Tax=Anopheles stephensi TaxID=30069 RepID=UPI001658B245|nr:E3 ubiquitin-protein ligase RFWD3-like [Anopheles stephensi]XP_035918124.1 E3 ubiquitin-protein ligase RFWD3-like [Anopheles stephensi]
MEESNDELTEESDETLNEDSGRSLSPTEFAEQSAEFNFDDASSQRSVNVLDNPVVHMEVELGRIQQGMLSPVILLNNVNNLPEVQATVEIRTEDGGNGDEEEEEEDTESIPLGSNPGAEVDRQPSNNVPEVQATIEVRTEDGNDDEDTEPIPLGSAPSGGSSQATLGGDRINEGQDVEEVEVIVQRPSGADADQPVVLSDSSPNRSGDMFTPRRKKRKRNATSPVQIASTPAHKKEEDEEGLLCSICLDEWTLTGEHRVVSLKCGHLFGMSCIKRWMQDKPAASRSCATCKARATMRDIRFIYARCVKAVDNTREEELLQELSREKLKVIDLNIKLSMVNAELAQQRQMVQILKLKIDANSRADPYGDKRLDSQAERRVSYKLFLEKNMEITREPGCRALAYSDKHQMLLISQKSTQPLFPGYSIRMVQVPEFTASAGAASMLVSSRSVRDIAIDASGDLFACATMEKSVKVFSIQNRTVQCTITPNQEGPLWSCAFDKERSKFLYLGSQRGSVYVYDIRQPDQLLEEFRVGHVQQDFTAVVKICPVEPTSTIPCGGFLVCKLKSVWFYEYTPTQQVESHLLNITGAFTAMSYNPASGLILISVRPTVDKPTTMVLASLEKLDGVFALKTQHTFEGSRVQTVMYRSAQVYLNDADTLVASYLEDAKMLSTWCTNSGRRWLQQLPMSEGILDICPILTATPGRTYLAALSECRCRIYRLNSE